MRSEMPTLFKKLYRKRILVSIAFHTVDPVIPSIDRTKRFRNTQVATFSQ